MNWDAIGAIGEIVGAAAVVLTLGYLALQVNHQTKTAKSDTRQRVLDRYSDALRILVSSDALRVITTGNKNFAELPNADKSVFSVIMSIFANNLINAIQLQEGGSLDNETLKYISNAFVMGIRSPGGAIGGERFG